MRGSARKMASGTASSIPLIRMFAASESPYPEAFTVDPRPWKSTDRLQ